jgi:hypothetical protein
MPINTNNICYLATLTASSSYSGWSPSNMQNYVRKDNGWCGNSEVPPLWVKATFPAPKTIGKFAMSCRYSYHDQAPTAFVLQGSDTGSFGGEEVQLGSWSGLSWNGNISERKEFTIDTPVEYQYYRIYITAVSGGGSNTASIMELEFFEETADNSAESYGTDIAPSSTSQTASSTYSTYTPAKMVDGDISTLWASNDQVPQWVQLEFASGRIVKKIAVTCKNADLSDQVPVFANLLGSNTGSFGGEETIIARLCFGSGWVIGERRELEVYNENSFTFYRLLIYDVNSHAGQWWVSIASLEMYEEGTVTTTTTTTSTTTTSSTTTTTSPPPMVTAINAAALLLYDQGSVLTVDMAGAIILWSDRLPPKRQFPVAQPKTRYQTQLNCRKFPIVE